MQDAWSALCESAIQRGSKAENEGVCLRTPISRVKWGKCALWVLDVWCFSRFPRENRRWDLQFVKKWNEGDSLASTPRLTAPSRSLTFGQRYGVVNEIDWSMWFPHRQHHGGKRKMKSLWKVVLQKVEAIFCGASTCSCAPIWQVDVNSQNTPTCLRYGLMSPMTCSHRTMVVEQIS